MRSIAAICNKIIAHNILANNILPYWDKNVVRNFAHEKECGSTGEGALIIGVYKGESNDFGQIVKLTPTGEKFNDRVANKLIQNIHYAAPTPGLGEVRLLYGLDPFFNVVAVTGLGNQCFGYNYNEQLDERKEAIRFGIGAAVKELQKLNTPKIYVDTCGHAESAAEGASMASWAYQELKDSKSKLKLIIPTLHLFDSTDFDGWQIGLHKASAQNLARHMMETPSNLLTPSAFAQSAVEILSKYAINVEVRMQNWAKLRNMNAFLSVGMGSCEPPVFLELLYEGCDPDICPVVMIGKGITFDTGGLCLKKHHDLRYQRGDMAGAAAVIATFRAIASLQLPLNVRGLIPLCVNSIGATAMKPGDTVRAMNGKTILIEDTDHSEGLLVMADILSYSKIFNPKFIIDVATLTPGGAAAMGSSASLVFSNSDSLYETLRIASIHTGDRIWRFPLWSYFNEYIEASKTTDVTNLVVPGVGGEPAKASAFLYKFVPENTDWIHMDTYNLTRTSGKPFSYLRRGMAGRPTRTLIEFLAQLCCKETLDRQKSCNENMSKSNNDIYKKK